EVVVEGPALLQLVGDRLPPVAQGPIVVKTQLVNEDARWHLRGLHAEMGGVSATGDLTLFIGGAEGLPVGELVGAEALAWLRLEAGRVTVQSAPVALDRFGTAALHAVL